MQTDPIEKRTDAGPIAIYLTPDEALVLDAFLSRGSAAGDNYGPIEHPAESRVLWDLASILESWLVSPLQPDYHQRLMRAREAVRDATG